MPSRCSAEWQEWRRAEISSGGRVIPSRKAPVITALLQPEDDGRCCVGESKPEGIRVDGLLASQTPTS